MDTREPTLFCTACQIEFAPTAHKRARWAVAGAGAVLGTVATDNVVGGLVIGGLCYGAATAADVLYFARRCPQCGTRGTALAEVEATVETAPAQSNGKEPVSAEAEQASYAT